MNFANLDFWWLLSVKDYWYAVVSAGIGAFIGIKWAKSESKRVFESLAHRNKDLLKTIIDFNLKQLKQIIDGYKEDSVEIPSYSLEHQAFSARIEANVDNYSKDLIEKLAWQKYQMQHVENKIVFLNVARPADTEKLRSQLSDLFSHVSTLHQELSALRVSL